MGSLFPVGGLDVINQEAKDKLKERLEELYGVLNDACKGGNDEQIPAEKEVEKFKTEIFQAYGIRVKGLNIEGFRGKDPEDQ